MIPVDKEFFKGHRCSACGWIRPTPPGKSLKQDAKEAFAIHKCSEHPQLSATRKA
jgi:hypothetical protein